MKLLFIALAAALSFEAFSPEEMDTVFSNYVIGKCDTIPELNKKVLAYIKKKMGKPVGTGYCFDIGTESLIAAGIKNVTEYNLGTKVDYKTECVFAGDIVQLDNVEISYKTEYSGYTKKISHQTLVIYKIKAKGNFVTAVQDSEKGPRKIRLDSLDLNHVVKGVPSFYRPTN